MTRKKKQQKRKYQTDSLGCTLADYRREIEAQYTAEGLLPGGHKITGTIRSKYKPGNGHHLRRTWEDADAAGWVYWYAYASDNKRAQIVTGNSYSEVVTKLRVALGHQERAPKSTSAPRVAASSESAGLADQLRARAAALRTQADTLDNAATALGV